ncbi:hypothetical protein CEXT_704791, partial [Caerostris extrusa]
MRLALDYFELSNFWSFQQSAIFSAFSAGDNAMLNYPIEFQFHVPIRGRNCLVGFPKSFYFLPESCFGFSVKQIEVDTLIVNVGNSSLKNSIADWFSGASVGGVILVARPAVMWRNFSGCLRVAEYWVGRTDLYGGRATALSMIHMLGQFATVFSKRAMGNPEPFWSIARARDFTRPSCCVGPEVLSDIERTYGNAGAIAEQEGKGEGNGLPKAGEKYCRVRDEAEESDSYSERCLEELLVGRCDKGVGVYDFGARRFLYIESEIIDDRKRVQRWIE